MLPDFAPRDEGPSCERFEIDRASFKEHAFEKMIARKECIARVTHNYNVFSSLRCFVQGAVSLECTRMGNLRRVNVDTHIVSHVYPRYDAADLVEIHRAARP